MKQRQANAKSDISRIELEIARLKVDLTERRQQLLDIQSELDACQQIVDAARTDYAKVKKRLGGNEELSEPEDDGNENDSDMWSEDWESDVSVYHGESFLQSWDNIVDHVHLPI